jgi:hypothetical protein
VTSEYQRASRASRPDRSGLAVLGLTVFIPRFPGLGLRAEGASGGAGQPGVSNKRPDMLRVRSREPDVYRRLLRDWNELLSGWKAWERKSLRQCAF